MPDRPVHHWGPALWTFLHTVTVIDLEDSDRQIHESKRVIELLKGISSIIPCYKCAKHYETFFHTEIEGKDRYQRMELFEIMVEYHNKVNQRLGKSIYTMNDARSIWIKTI